MIRKSNLGNENTITKQIEEMQKKERNTTKKVWSEEQFAVLEKLCSLNCTQEEIENIMSTDIDVMNRLCKEHYTTNQDNPMTLRKVQERFRAKGYAQLREWQFKYAGKGNTGLLIWLGKQYLGQKDNPDVGKEIDDIKNNLADLTEILKNPLKNRDITELEKED